jgi:hypothetical protein
MIRAVAGALPIAPQAAVAECLGGGCYDGIAMLAGLAVAWLLTLVVMVVLMFMRRWTGVWVAVALLAVIPVLAALVP